MKEEPIPKEIEEILYEPLEYIEQEGVVEKIIIKRKDLVLYLERF